MFFGCSKFNNFIFGQHVTVESDHKPLQSIHKKGTHEMPVRLQNLMFQLQKYDLDIVFKPGKSMFLSDHLSKSFLEESNENLCKEMSINEIHLLSYLSVLPEKRDEIRPATMEDHEMTLLQDVTVKDWPETKDQLLSYLSVLPEKRDEIRRATMEDHEMTLLQDVTVKDWPETKDQLQLELRTYYRDEIATIDG